MKQENGNKRRGQAERQKGCNLADFDRHYARTVVLF
jgi:hypothetical protein